MIACVHLDQLKLCITQTQTHRQTHASSSTEGKTHKMAKWKHEAAGLGHTLSIIHHQSNRHVQIPIRRIMLLNHNDQVQLY